MPITLGSSGITFSNGTSQTTAMPADKGKPISVTSFTSSGTYTVPSGCTMILVQLVGGGGGSAGGAIVMNGTMDTPITLPNMSVDVNTGRNV